MNRWQLEDIISARSYEIWEREGRKTGCADEYWDRARQEVEGEIRAALEGHTEYVLPNLRVSQRPVRYDGVDREAA